MGFRKLLWVLSNHGEQSRSFLLQDILQGPTMPHREPPPDKIPPPKVPPTVPPEIPDEDEDDDEDDPSPPSPPVN